MRYHAVVIENGHVTVHSTDDVERAEGWEYGLRGNGMMSISFGDINGGEGYTVVYFNPDEGMSVPCDDKGCIRNENGVCGLQAGLLRIAVPSTCRILKEVKE